MNWLFWSALAGAGEADLARRWRDQGLAQLKDLTYGEYYHPLTGEPLGSHDQSWTAAVALDWIADAG